MRRHGDASRFSHPGFVDLTGTALAGCVVLERAPNVNGNARWHVIAACGHMCIVEGIVLRAAQKRDGKIRCPECRPKRPGTVMRRKGYARNVVGLEAPRRSKVVCKVCCDLGDRRSHPVCSGCGLPPVKGRANG